MMSYSYSTHMDATTTLAMRDQDEQPVLQNCGPSPASVYRTAPAGTVHVLDLCIEVQGCDLLPKRVRTAFQPQGTRYDNDLPLPNELPAPPITPDHAVPLLASVYAMLPPPFECGVRSVLRLPSRSASGHARGAGPFTDDDACSAITQLTRRLHRLGCLAPVNGLVSWSSRTPLFATGPATSANAPRRSMTGQPLPWIPEPPEHARTDEYRALIRLAWILSVVSHAAPPIVLFTRTPSLRYWRADGMLSVRWLGPTGGAA